MSESSAGLLLGRAAAKRLVNFRQQRTHREQVVSFGRTKLTTGDG